MGLLARRAWRYRRARSLPRPKARIVATVLIAGIICSHPKNLNPANGHPHMIFNVAEGGQVWRVSAEDQAELGTERLMFGDAVAVVGLLDIHVEADRAGRRRVAFCVEAKQILFLRNRSIVKAAAMHEHQTMASGFARPPIG